MIGDLLGRFLRGDKLDSGEIAEVEAFLNRMESLKGLVKDGQSVSDVGELFGDSSTIVKGEFISPSFDSTSTEPTNSGFSGVAQTGNGYSFLDDIWHWVVVKLGNLSVGANADGDFLAANGEYKINEDGTLSNGLTFLHRFEATFGGITRQAYLGMFVPDGGTQPSFRVYYNEPASSNLVLNGSFESGDETSWTDTNTSWNVVADATYGYSLQHDSADTGCPPTETQDIAVSASTVYSFSFASKLTSGPFPPSVSLIWKDGGATVVRTDTIIGGSSAGWTPKSGIYTSPSTAATVTISVHSGEIFTDCSVSAFSLYALTSYSSIDFYDSKILLNAYPGKPVNPMGLEQKAEVIAHQMIYSATAALTVDSAQQLAFYKGPSAANANNADTVDISVVLAAGTYTMTMLGVSTADSGKVDTYIDGSGVASFTADDFYSAVTTRNVTKTHSVTFTTGGRHTIRFKVNGKNASATDYRVLLTAVYFVPSAYTVEA